MGVTALNSTQYDSNMRAFVTCRVAGAQNVILCYCVFVSINLVRFIALTRNLSLNTTAPSTAAEVATGAGSSLSFECSTSQQNAGSARQRQTARTVSDVLDRSVKAGPPPQTLRWFAGCVIDACAAHDVCRGGSLALLTPETCNILRQDESIFIFSCCCQRQGDASASSPSSPAGLLERCVLLDTISRVLYLDAASLQTRASSHPF